MNILMFLLENWHNILVVAILILTGIVGINNWVVKNGPILLKMSVKERFEYITRLLKNLVSIALVLVTDAEIKFGGGTGQLKRSYVIDELYKRIPDEYKKFVTEENLDAIINKALEEAEKLWSENSKVKTLVYSGAPMQRVDTGVYKK